MSTIFAHVADYIVRKYADLGIKGYVFPLDFPWMKERGLAIDATEYGNVSLSFLAISALHAYIFRKYPDLPALGMSLFAQACYFLRY